MGKYLFINLVTVGLIMFKNTHFKLQKGNMSIFYTVKAR